MKILMVTMGMDIGGAETHILELAGELTARGHSVTVASNGGVYVPQLEAAGIKHVTLPLNTKRLLAVKRATSGLAKLIRDENFDIVHSHARIPNFICSSLQKKLSFRFVTTTHGVYNTTFLLRIMSHWGQRCLAVSDDIRDYLIKYYGIPKSRITVTINGIDTKKFDKNNTSGTNEVAGTKDRRILYVSRIDNESAHVAFMLADAAEELIKLYPDAGITIVGGGTAFDELKVKCDKFNRRAGREFIHLTGPRTDIANFMASCDVFVGVSRSAMEAMASSLPTVLAGSQGYLGIFKEDKLSDALDTNFCCRGKEMPTSEILLRDIKNIFDSSEEQLSHLAEYGRATIEKYYAVSRMADDCLDVYSQVMRDPKPFKGSSDVLISGYYGFGNMGDDSILETITENLTAANPDIRIAALTHSPKKAKKRFGIKCISRVNPFSILKEMYSSRLLISGGGSLFQDSTSGKSLRYYTTIVNLARLMKMKTYIYANGIGVINSERNKRTVAKTVNKADMISVRDMGSFNTLESIGVAPDKIHISADPAFLMKPYSTEETRDLCKNIGIPYSKPFFAVSLRSFKGLQKNEYSEDTLLKEVCAACAKASVKYSMTPVFVTMQPNVDSEILHRAVDLLHEKYSVESAIISPDSGHELLSILRGGGMNKAEFVLSMRLHTLIYACSAAVPAIGLSLDPKIDDFINLLEKTHLCSVKDLKNEDLCAVIDDIMEHPEENSVRLSYEAEKLKEKAREDIDAAIGMLRS